MSDDTCKIKKFFPGFEDLVNKVIIVLGPRGTGKTFLIKDLLCYLRKIPIVKIINGTENETGHYGRFAPELFVSGETDEDAILEEISSFVERQRDLAQKKRKDPAFRGIDNRALLLIDDLNFDEHWLRKKVIRYILMNGRHAKITFILALQSPLGVPKQLRGCVDLVFILAHSSPTERETIYKNYSSGVKGQTNFDKLMDLCTKDRHCMVIKKNQGSSDINKQIFYYKAKPRDNFILGHPLIWKHHRDNFNKDYVTEESNDFGNKGKKKKRTGNDETFQLSLK